MIRSIGMLGLLLCTGCLKSQGVACGDGATCAPGTVCDLAHYQCVTPDQLTSCADRVDGDVCPIPGAVGICRDGVCLAVVCGDGLVQSSELCDGSPPALTCLQSGYEAGFLDCNNALCTPDFAGCRRVGWKETAVVDTFGVREISTAGGLALAAWGSGVLRYDGASWVPMNLGESGGFTQSVLVLSPTLAYAVTEDYFYRFDGTAWTVDPSVTVSTSPRALLAGTSPSNVYLFLDTATYRFDGQTWSLLPSAPSPVRYAWASANELWVIALGVLYRGSGSQWTMVTTPLDAVHSVTGFGSTVYIGGVIATAAVVARGDGSSWQTFDISRELDASVGPTSIELGGRSDSDLYAYAAGVPGLVWFDGSSWRRTANVAAYTIASVGAELFAGHATGVVRESPTSVADVSDIVTAAGAVRGGAALSGTSCDDVFVSIASVSTADDGMLFHYDGVAWTLEHTRAMDPITDVFATAGEVYATTYAGAVLRRSGTSWTVIQTFSAPLRTLWASGSFILAAGDGGWVHRFDGTWTSAQLPGAAGVQDVWGIGPDDLYAVTYGTDPVLHFDGTSWSPVVFPSPPAPLQSIWGDGEGTLVLVGANGEAWHREQGGWRRDPTLPFGGYRALHGSSASDVFAATDQGTIAHYDGMRWAPVRTPGLTPSTIRAAWTTPSCTYFARDYASFGLVRLTRRTPW